MQSGVEAEHNVIIKVSKLLQHRSHHKIEFWFDQNSGKVEDKVTARRKINTHIWYMGLNPTFLFHAMALSATTANTH